MVRKFKLLFFSVLCFWMVPAFGQLSFRHHYYQTDLTAYKTYQIGAFAINGQHANPEENEQVSLIQSKLHEALSRLGLEQHEDPDMLVFLLLKTDTLGASLPAAENPELMINFTVDLRQSPGFEKIFKGTVHGFNVSRQQSEARLKKIYAKFFRNFDQ